MSELRDIFDKALFQEGSGPNGSGGQFYYFNAEEELEPLEDKILAWHNAELERVIGDQSLNGHIKQYFQRHVVSWSEAERAVAVRQELIEEQRKRALK